MQVENSILIVKVVSVSADAGWVGSDPILLLAALRASPYGARAQSPMGNEKW